MIILGSEATGTLELSDPRRGESGELWWLTANLRTPGLAASTQVEAHYADGFDDLISFFDDLAARWRGWEGAVEYDSLEHDLRLGARHDGIGHVILTVRLAGPNPLTSGWLKPRSRRTPERRWRTQRPRPMPPSVGSPDLEVRV